MARPRRTGVVIIPLKLWLIPGRDDDLIAFLKGIPPGQRAAAILRAMRGGLANQPQMPTEEEETNSILDSLGDWNA